MGHRGPMKSTRVSCLLLLLHAAPVLLSGLCLTVYMNLPPCLQAKVSIYFDSFDIVVPERPPTHHVKQSNRYHKHHG